MSEKVDCKQIDTIRRPTPKCAIRTCDLMSANGHRFELSANFNANHHQLVLVSYAIPPSYIYKIIKRRRTCISCIS